MNVDEQYDVVLRLLAEKPLRMADDGVVGGSGRYQVAYVADDG